MLNPSRQHWAAIARGAEAYARQCEKHKVLGAVRARALLELAEVQAKSDNPTEPDLSDGLIAMCLRSGLMIPAAKKAAPVAVAAEKPKAKRGRKPKEQKNEKDC